MTRWALIALLVIVGCSGDKGKDSGHPATAAPAAPRDARPATSDAGASRALSPARPRSGKVDLASYKKELARGRKLAKAGKHDAAIAAFEKALEAKPRDATANSEISWAALQAGDLDRAERAARAAVRDGKTAQVRAASLYNLGLILEKLEKKPEAVTALERSFAMRPNDTVERKLFDLTNRDAGQHPRTAMAGPMTLKKLCESAALDVMNSQYPDKPIYEPDCVGSAVLRGADGKDLTLTLPAPYREVQIRVVASLIHDETEEQPDHHETCYLAIGTKAGWYTTKLLDYQDDCTDAMAFELARGPDLPSGTPTIEVRTRYRAEREELNGRKQTEEKEGIRYCAIGSSGVASCVPNITTSERENGALEHAASVSFDGATIVIVGRDGKLPYWGKKALGSFPVSFP